MEILNASDAKREYAQLEALKEKQLKAAIEEGIADLQAGKVVDGNIIMEKLRKRIDGLL